MAWIPAAQADGLLDRIKGGCKIVIAHRESSVPFSYVDPQAKKPLGYALDLCLKIAEASVRKVGVKNVPVEFLQVTPADRIPPLYGKVGARCRSANRWAWKPTCSMRASRTA